MTMIELNIYDAEIDGFTIRKRAKAAGGLYEVHLSHRIDSAHDYFGRPLGSYVSGSAVGEDLVSTYLEAHKAMQLTVMDMLHKQNNSPPSAEPKLSLVVPSSGEVDDLLNLLEL